MTTLKFPDIINLIEFRLLVEKAVKYHNLTHFTLTGQFTEAEIALARQAYGATVLNEFQN